MGVGRCVDIEIQAIFRHGGEQQGVIQQVLSKCIHESDVLQTPGHHGKQSVAVAKTRFWAQIGFQPSLVPLPSITCSYIVLL